MVKYSNLRSDNGGRAVIVAGNPIKEGFRIIRVDTWTPTAKARAEYSRLERKASKSAKAYRAFRAFERKMEAGNGAELARAMARGYALVRVQLSDRSPH